MIVRDLWARLGMQVDSGSFGKAQGALARLHLAFGGLRDIVTTVRAGIKEMLGDVADRAFDAKRLSSITGLTTDKVQELTYAAKVSGISVEELQHGLVHLSRSASEAAKGNAEAGAAFFSLGVRATDGLGKARPLDQLLADLAVRFQAMPDGPNKAALAMHVFSRGGARMIEMLNKGPAGLQKLGEEARRLGVVMDSGGIAVAIGYREALLRMQGAVEGLKNTIAGGLFPALTKSAEQMSQAIAKYRQWIALRVHQTFELVSRAASLLFRSFKGIIDLFERIWKSGGAAKGILITLGVVAASLVAPFAALAAAIAVVAEDVELFFSSHGKAKTLTGVLVDGFALLKKKAGEVWDGFLGKWEEFKDHPFSFLYDEMKAFFAWLGKAMVEALTVHLPRELGKALFGPSGEEMAKMLQPGEPQHRDGFVYRVLHSVFGPGAEDYKKMGVNPGDPRTMGAAGIANSLFNKDWVKTLTWPFLQSPGFGAAPAAPMLPPGAGVTINFGDIVLPPGANDGEKLGKDFLGAVTPELRRVFEELWDTRMRETAAAVRR